MSMCKQCSGSLQVWGPGACAYDTLNRQLFKWPHLCFQSRHWATCYLFPLQPLLLRSSPLPQRISSVFSPSSPGLFWPFSLWQRVQLTRQPRQQLALRVCSSLATFINHGSMTWVTVLSTVTNVWNFTVFIGNMQKTSYYLNWRLPCKEWLILLEVVPSDF